MATEAAGHPPPLTAQEKILLARLRGASAEEGVGIMLATCREWTVLGEAYHADVARTSYLWRCYQRLRRWDWTPSRRSLPRS